MGYLLAVVLAYLLGSFPTGVVVVRLARGFDVRRIGSQRSGTTNVIRAAGAAAGAAVFVLDVLKGLASVWLGRSMAESGWLGHLWGAWTARSVSWPLSGSSLALWVPLTCGLAAIAGHNWPVYIRFHGGRGVATGLGTLLALFPLVAGISLLVGLGVIALTRYVSLGSISGVLCIPLGLFVQMAVASLPLPHLFYGVLVAGVTVFQHRDNIARLRAGTERRLGDPARSAEDGPRS